MRRCALLLSGGIDSTTLLASLKNEGHEVFPLSIYYGQKHRKELDAASAIAAWAGCTLKIVDLPSFGALCETSALTKSDVSVPHGHYAAESMKSTIVPNRNMVFIALAASYAIEKQCDAVAYAAHAGDHTIYPDCRPEFADAMDRALQLCDWKSVRLWRPFVHQTKAEIVRRGAELGVPLELTWSCYEGQETHCGRCGTCVERREAFQIAGVKDPTSYRSV